MRRALLISFTSIALASCSTLEWPTGDDDDLTAQELGDRHCRQSRPSDPVARGEWVCENPRTGEVEQYRENPIYDPDNSR